MAIYHLSTKPIKRSSGRTATASSAYRSGAKLEDKRTGKIHDYTKKSGVVFSKCLLATDDNIQELDRSELWNLAEQSEKRKDARTAREIIVNIPHELPESERQKLVDDFAIKLSKDFGVGVDYAIHLPDKHGDNRNHHAHIMMTTRNATYENDELKLHDKTRLELSNTKLQKLGLPKTQEQIKQLRENWANITNKALERNNIDARIDHRSYAEQGNDQIPTVKLGWKASALERKGIKTDRGDINRAIAKDNKRIEQLRSEIDDYKAKYTPEIKPLPVKKQDCGFVLYDNYNLLVDMHNRSIESLESGYYTSREATRALKSVYEVANDVYGNIDNISKKRGFNKETVEKIKESVDELTDNYTKFVNKTTLKNEPTITDAQERATRARERCLQEKPKPQAPKAEPSEQPTRRLSF